MGLPYPYFFTPLFSQIIATSHLQPSCHPLRGRTEGAQVEQMILFYEACQRLNHEGESITMDAINAKINQIWDELITNEESNRN